MLKFYKIGGEYEYGRAASKRERFEAIGGQMVLVADDGHHKTYDLILNEVVVGSYTSWCGRQPCYHDDAEDLQRVAGVARSILGLDKIIIVEADEVIEVIGLDDLEKRRGHPLLPRERERLERLREQYEATDA